MPPAVSVLIPARNAAATLAGVLDALARQTVDRSRFEVIVADNASTDATPAIASKHSGVQIVSSESDLAPSGARNLAARVARADLLAMLDADCVPDPDWIERGLARFEADPQLQILGGQVTISLPEHPSLVNLVDAGSFLRQEGNVKSGGWALTAAMWMRREAFDRAQGFNEHLRWAGEDRELCRCALASGGRIEFAEEVHATHPPRSSGLALARKAYRNGRAGEEMRRFARVPISEPRLALRPRYYLPRTTLRRIGRLRDRGVEVGPLRRGGMAVVEVAFVSIPLIAGDLVGSVRGLAGFGGRR